MRQKVWHIAGLTTLILVAAIVALNVRSDGDANNTVTVGVLLPLSGEAAVYGQALRRGIELAREEDGQDSAKIRLVFDDDQGTVQGAVTAFQRMLAVHKPPIVIGGAMSSTAEAIIPLADRSRVVLLSPTATKPSLPGMSPFFFRLWPSDDYDGRIMAETAYRDLGVRRVSILYINLAYGQGITGVFEREFRALGGQIASKDGYGQGETDFRSVLTRIKALNPDAIYLPGYVAEVSQILRQARQLGLETRFLGVNSLYDPNLLTVAGPAAEGAVFTYPAFEPTDDRPVAREFVRAFETKYREQPDAFAAQGYDAYRVVARALESSSPPFTGESIDQALHALGRQSGPSGTFEFDATGDVQKKLHLFIVRNGQFQRLSPQQSDAP